MKNRKDYSAFSTEKLVEELNLLNKKKYDFRVKLAIGQLKETHLIALNKREIARIKQLLSKKNV